MSTLHKVLFYNWAPALNPEKLGGGVAVYQDNCILSFLNKGWQVHSLSAGNSYDAFGGRPYITKICDGPKSHVAFILVNSPVVAPTENSFFTDQVTAGSSEDRKVAAALHEFIQSNGPYDVVHFNNLEGLPASVLPMLRQEFCNTRFVFSLHNYYPLCPQVNLWKNNSTNCDGKEGGRACMSCLGEDALRKYKARASDVVSGRAISDLIFGRLAQPRRSFVRRAIRKCLRIARAHRAVTFLRRRFGIAFAFEAEYELQKNDLAVYFGGREQKMVQIINDSFDVILCVSERVKIIAQSAGLSSVKCKVSYIGSKFYRTPLPVRKPTNDLALRLAFLGYANKVKGFDFLLNALEQCPDRLLRKLNLMIAARGIDQNMKDRLSALAYKVDGLTVHKGYSHGQLDELLSDVDLGVVPVVWEDCLPQVAIEFVCNGVPIVTSDLGGAREIASNADFEFNTGSHDGLIRLLEKFSDDKQKLSGFWKKEPTLRSMDAHVTELLVHYGSL
jgi:glycosyltransferase involved in cell wall biosynthesis